jgi:hypothetical protein
MVGNVASGVVMVAAFRVGEYGFVLGRDIEGQETFDEVYEA